MNAPADLFAGLAANDAPPPAVITVELPHEQAWAFAEFLKRSCWSDYRDNAINGDEAHLMVEAGYRIRRALAAEGFDPR